MHEYNWFISRSLQVKGILWPVGMTALTGMLALVCNSFTKGTMEMLSMKHTTKDQAWHEFQEAQMMDQCRIMSSFGSLHLLLGDTIGVLEIWWWARICSHWGKRRGCLVRCADDLAADKVVTQKLWKKSYIWFNHTWNHPRKTCKLTKSGQFKVDTNCPDAEGLATVSGGNRKWHLTMLYRQETSHSVILVCAAGVLC